jgi:hypothetical protein
MQASQVIFPPQKPISETVERLKLLSEQLRQEINGHTKQRVAGNSSAEPYNPNLFSPKRRMPASSSSPSSYRPIDHSQIVEQQEPDPDGYEAATFVFCACVFLLRCIVVWCQLEMWWFQMLPVGTGWWFKMGCSCGIA